MAQTAKIPATTTSGWPIFFYGLPLNIISSSQEVLIFELGTVICMLAAVLLLTRGTALHKAKRCMLFAILFMTPLSGRPGDAMMAAINLAGHLRLGIG